MTISAIIYAGINKTKIMLKNIIKTPVAAQFRALLVIGLVLGSVSGYQIAHADIYDEQIKALQAQNAEKQGTLSGLTAQAGSYQAQINQLQAQINGVQAQINANQAQQAALQQQITDAQNKITEEKRLLGIDLKNMYIDGQLSTIEQLATSKNLSDYVDKAEGQAAIQNKIHTLIDEIAALQVSLGKQKAELDQLIVSEEQQHAQLASAQAQQQSMLSYNQSQQDSYNAQISANSGKISDLRRQQILANARFIGNSAPGTGPACGGGYPAKWCEIPQDSVIDSWGMYNRECVSYTAFRVAASGRHMPYWGGIGNANQWDDNARRIGIPVDGNPQPGDVAISNRGAYGHAMYVESVNGDGTFNLSQYNAALDGRYSTRSGVSPEGLYFIHF